MHRTLRRSLPLTTVLVLLLGLLPVGAAAQAPPGDRADVRHEGSVSEDGASVHVEGRAGARGFDNRVEVTPERIRVTNPPMAGALVVDAGGPRTEREELYGPRAGNATLGSGGITSVVDRQGRLTGLNWPSPGHWDHVNHLNVTRDYPNEGAPLNAGSFGGVGDGWLTPEFGWQVVEQRHASADTQTLVTELTNPDLGLDVTVTDVVDPTRSLIARNYAFSRPLQDGFAYYANMNPSTGRAPSVPSVPDAAADDTSDFATAYDAERGALLHLRPYTFDPASASRLATSQPSAETARGAVEGTFGADVYIAVAGQQPAAQHQAGLETVGLVRGEAEGSPLLDPYYDLQDGALSGSPAAVGKTAGALAELPADPDGTYTVYLAAGESSDEAFDLIDMARARGFAAVRTEADDWWGDWIGRARLPDTDDERTLAVTKQALMLIRTAQDRETGAIVANATPQTPYRQDWVRDGAFFSYALLLAGYPDMAVQHGDFYREVYRPGGTWDSFYYADGAEAGAAFSYEIDSQGFALWTLWLPYAFGDAGRDYLERVYPAIADTADALLLCRDPSNGLQCYAPEDDAYMPSQGAQGAAAVYLALRSAVDAARSLGAEPNPEWGRRADEIRTAVLEHLCDGQACQGGRGGIYLVWPSGILTEDDATADLLQSHLQRYVRKMERESSWRSPRVGGFFQYPMEPLLALAPFWGDPDADARLDAWNEWLTHEVAEPGVLHYGERIYRDGGRSYLHTVGFPHIWSGAEMYLGAAFTYGLDGCAPGTRSVGLADCSTDRRLPGVGSVRAPASPPGRGGVVVPA